VTEAESGGAGDSPEPEPTPTEASQADVEEAIEQVGSPERDEAGADAGGESPFDNGEVPPEAEEAFDEVDVGTLDEEEAWSRVETDDDDGAEAGSTAGESRERREMAVPKSTYCERCEHFSAPPRMECTHDGTEILELVDREHVRVADCPVVEERDALGEHETDAATDDEASEIFID
jgi:hypothetical protein